MSPFTQYLIIFNLNGSKKELDYLPGTHQTIQQLAKQTFRIFQFDPKIELEMG